MAYAKLKKEEYKNIGGINTKASVYVTGDREVMDLINYDFQTPGAWTQRPGITSVINGNTLAIGASNRLNFGFQTFIRTSNRISASFTQATFFVGNSFTYSFTGGVFTPGSVLSASGALPTTAGFGNSVNVMTGSTNAQSLSYSNIGYFTAGKQAYKASPLGIYYYGLPYYVNGDDLFAYPTYTSGGVGGLNGTYVFYLAYQDIYNYAGPVGYTLAVVPTPMTDSIEMTGFSFTQQALQSGATYINIYSDRVQGFPATESRLIFQVPLGATLASIHGLANSNLSPLGNYGINDTVTNFKPITFVRGAVLGDPLFYSHEADVVEFFSGRLFWGMSSGKNIIYYSEIVEFVEDAQQTPAENFEFVQNQQFPLTGLKSYNQSLLVFFQKGVSRLVGTDPHNFYAVELTTEYGLVNQRAVVEFNEKIWFLDTKEIVEFNGSNMSSVSDRVNAIISRMNLNAAQKTATAYHYENRNEVWFAIPIDGSEENNIIIVHDYLANGWYTTKSPSSFTMLQAIYDQTLVASGSASTVYMNNKRLFTSHPGGSMGYFDESITTDYNQGITLSYKSRYHCDQGPSTTMEWRRLYLDTGPWAGVTLSFNTNFYANFATATISATRTIWAVGSPYSGPQQTRIDFGIAAKSLSHEVMFVSSTATPIVRIYGYTVESRFLRSV